MPDLKVPGLGVRAMGGSVKADATIASLVDEDAAYMEFDAVSSSARFGAKGNGAAVSRGLTLRTLNAGVAVNAVVIAADGSMTLGSTTIPAGKTLSLGGATIAGAPTWASNQALTLSTAAQPNVTSLGTLTSLQTSGIAGFGQAPEANNAVAARGATSDNTSNLFLGRNAAGVVKFAVGSDGSSLFSATMSATDVVFDTTVALGSGRVQLKTAGTRFGFMGTGAWAFGDGTTDLALAADVGGGIKFGTNGALKGQMTSGGVFAWGTTVTTGASAGDIIIPNGNALRGVQTGGGTTPLIGIDTTTAQNIVIGTGGFAVRGYYGGPYPVSANLRDGTFGVDSATPGQFFFYAGGARYKVVGTAF